MDFAFAHLKLQTEEYDQIGTSDNIPKLVFVEKFSCSFARFIVIGEEQNELVATMANIPSKLHASLFSSIKMRYLLIFQKGRALEIGHPDSRASMSRAGSGPEAPPRSRS